MTEYLVFDGDNGMFGIEDEHGAVVHEADFETRAEAEGIADAYNRGVATYEEAAATQDSEKTQCEGWRRKGGAFTLGPVTWTQCDNDAVVMITAKQKGEDIKTFPACMECWHEALQFKIEILEAVPLEGE